MTRPTARTRRHQLLARSALAGLGVAVAIGASPAAAQVTGVGTVTYTSSNGGAVGVSTSGGVTDITTNAGRSLVEWTSLNVNTSEQLNFYFNNRTDIVLNRVAGAASIDGILNGCMATCATKGGNVWILSAGGVVIGANAQISTGGFLAAVGNITDGDFFDGDMNFAFTGPDEGAISVAAGASINTAGGSIALIAPTINTQAGSTVSASGAGNVLYGSASNYNVTFAPTTDNDLDLVSFQVPAGADGAGGLYGGSIILGGATTGNRVYAAVVSKAGLTSTLLATGAITATSVGTDETGAIILSNNRDITGGVMSAAPVTGSGIGTLTNHGVLTAPEVTLAASGALLFSDDITATGGSVALSSDTGTVHQNDGEITANTLTVSAATDIVLAAGFDGDVNNVAQLTGLTSTSGNISYVGGSYQIAGAISAPGTVGLSSTGTISGAGQISAGSISLSGQGAINVLGAANLLYSASTGNLTIHATGGIAMTDGWDLNGHTLNLIADAGSIIQTGDAIFDGGTLNATATGDIDFGSQSNYATVFTGTSSGGGDIAFRGNGNVTTGASTTTGQLSLTSDSGSITASAGITVGSLTASAAGSITLDGAISSVDDVTAGANILLDTYSTGMDLTGDIIGQTISLSSHVSVTQSGGKIDASRLNVITSGDISLTGANEIDVVGRLDTDRFDLGTVADITLRNVGDIVLDYLVEAPGGTIDFTSDTGGISQTAAGAIIANRLIASAAGNIDLYVGANDVVRIGGLSSTNGDIVYRDVNSFDIQGDITTDSSPLRGVMLAISGVGTLTQTTGILDVGYFRGLTNGAITLGGANLIRRLITTTTNGAFTLNTTTNLSVDGTVAANTVSLTTTGAITQAAAAQIWTDTLNVSAVTGVTLTTSGGGANNIGNLGVVSNATSGGIVIINDNPTMNLTGNVTAAGQAVSISNTMAGINQTGGIITADSLSLSAAHGISATRNNVVGSLGAVTAGGNFAFTNAGDLYLTDNINVGANTVSVTSNTGQIEQTTGVITAGSLNLQAGGRIWVNNANAVTSLGTVTAGGHILFRNAGDTVVGGDITAIGRDVTLRSNTGSITQTAGSDITSDSLQVIAATGVTLTNAGNAINELAWVNVTSGGLAFGQTNGFQIGGPVLAGGQIVSLTSLSGAITQTSGSALQAGTLNASAAGTLTLNQGNNVTNLGVISTGGSFLFRDVDGFSLTGNLTAASQVVMLAQNGSITQNGGIITAADINAMATVDILLGRANQVGAISALSAGQNLLYRQVADLTAPTISAAGTVSLYSTTGDITQTGTITADTLVLGAADDIILGQNFITKLGQIDAGGDFTAADANGLSVGALGLTGNITVGGAMTLVNPGAIFQTSSTAITAGSLFIDTDGALSATGANSISGNTRLSATGAAFNAVGDLTLQVNVTGFATISSTGAVEIGGVGASTGDTLNIQAANGISQTQTLTFTNFGNLTNTTAGGIDLTNSSWLTLNGTISAVGQYVGLNVVTGGIIQSSGSTITAQRLGVTTTQGANLYEMNNVAELGDVDTGAHNFVFRTWGDLLIDGDVTSGLNMNLTSATGGISQTAGSDIKANALYVMAETGISLTNAGNDVDKLGTMINLGSGGIAYAQTDGFQIDSVVRALNQTVSLTSVAGGISETGTAFAQIEAGTLNASAAGALTLHRDNAVGTVNLNGTTISYVNVGSFAANVITGDTVSLTSTTGKITQTASTGRIVADSLTASAATGLEFFGGQNDIRLLAGLSSTSGGVTWRDMGGFEITGNINATGQTVELVSDGTGADGTDVTQSGGVITANRLQGTSAGDLLFTSANLVGQLGYLNAGGNIRYRGAASYILQDNVNAAGGLILNSDTGSIQQFGGAIVADAFAGTAAQGISLSRVNDVDFLGAVDSGAGDFNFRDLDSFDMAGLITSDNGILLQAGGNITQSSGSIVTGTLSLFASGTAIVNGSGNDIDFLGLSTGMNALAFTDVDGFGISDRVFSSGAITLTATTGDITEVAGGYLSANGLSVYASNGEIDLAGDNSIENVGDLMAGGDLTFHDTDGFLTFGNIAGDAVRLTTADGAIAQLSGAIGANSLYASAQTGLNLIAIGNDVDVITGLVNLTSGGISYHNADSVSITGAVTAIGQTVNFDVNGNLSQTVTGVISAGRVQGAAMGAFALADAANGIEELGPISASSIDLVTVDTGLTIVGALNATGGVALKADDFITQTTAGTITGQTLRAQADGDIILAEANDLDSITLLYSDLGDITYNDVDGVSLDGSSLGDFWTSGTFTLTAGGTGDITQSGAALRAGTLLVNAGGDITLDLDNRIDVLGNSSAGGSVFRVINLGDLDVAGDISVAHPLGALVLISNNGKVEQTSGEIDAYTVGGASAGDFVLTNFTGALGDISTMVGDIDVSNAADIVLFGRLLTDNAHSVTLTSTGGSITQSIGRIETGTLNLDAAISIALDAAQSNDVERLGTVSTYSNFAFRNDDSFDLSGDIDVSMIGGGVVLTADSGAITQSAGVITAYGLNLQTATGLDLSGANMVDQLTVSNGSTGNVGFVNAKALNVLGVISSAGIDLETTAGLLTVSGGVLTGGAIDLAGAGGVLATGSLGTLGDVTVTAAAGDIALYDVIVGDDLVAIASDGDTQVRNLVLTGSSDNEADGGNAIIHASGDAFLGARDEAGIVGQLVQRAGGVGEVTVASTGDGDAGVFLQNANTTISLSAGTDGTATYVLGTGDLQAGNVSGTNVVLKANAGMVTASSVILGGGDYTLYGQDFSTGAFGFIGAARDIAVTDTAGLLELTSSLIANRNLSITAVGSVLDGTGSVSLLAGLDADDTGVLTVTAASITLAGAGADGDVTLTATSGNVDVGTVGVSGNYTLSGAGFSTGALSPIGATAGTWSIADSGGFDFTGLTLTYNGDIEIQANDDITGGAVQSITGSVSIDGPSAIDIENLYAGADITVTTTGDLTLDSATAYGGDITLSVRDSLTVEGFLEAAGDVMATANNGTADVNAATAGRNITVQTSSGDAILGAATLTGATGDLTILADGGGDVIFGVLDYTTVSTDNVFSRAAGSTGAVTLQSVTGDVTANLWSSARLDLVRAYLDAEVSTETADLEIGEISSTGGEIYAEAVDGNLTIGEAIAPQGFLGLYASGNLTILDSAYGNAGVEIEVGGLLDASLASAIVSRGDMSLTGGSVQVTHVVADGDLAIGAVGAEGDVYVEFAETDGFLSIGSLDGDAILRRADALDGIELFAFGNITLGADTTALISNTNYISVSGGGCGCGPGDITVVSAEGDVLVNLNRVTGVFDAIGAAIDGDVDIVIENGNLKIADLAGYNIAVDVRSGTLETGYGDPSTYGVFLAGGDYSITANGFLGNALTPNLPFGTLNDYTVVQRGGVLDMTGVQVVAQGDIAVTNTAGNLVGDAQLTAAGDVTVTANGIAVDTIDAGGDVALNGGASNVNVATSVTVGGDYSLAGADFSLAALSPLGAKAGDLRITDVADDFDYSSATLTWGGDITISAMGGMVLGGDITSASGNIEIQADGIDVGVLSAASGQIDAYGYGPGGVTVASATALDDIYIYTSAGNAILGAAALLGAGTNSLLVNASVQGNAILGSTTAGGITDANSFTSNGSMTLTSVQAAGGSAYVYLDSSDAITTVTALSGEIGIAVRSGDFDLGSAYSFAGEIDIDGPDGRLTVGSLNADGNIGIRGADITLTNVDTTWNLFVTASGDLTLAGPDGVRSGRIAVDNWIVLEADDVMQDADAGFSAVRLVVDATGDVSLLGLNQVEILGNVTGDSFAYRSVLAGGFDIGGGIDVGGGTVELIAENGGITQGSGYTIVASSLTGSSQGGADFAGYNDIDALGDFDNTGGAFILNAAQALTIVGTVESDSAVVIQTRSGGMTIASNGTISSTASGDAVVLASNGVFANNSGADAVQAANGRWLIYTQAYNDPSGSTAGDNYGGLDGKSYYGTAYDFAIGNFSGPINAGNRFVHAYQPILTVTPNSLTTIYNGQIPTLTALITGLVNGDLATDAWNGSPLISGATSKNVGTYGLIASLGTLLSDMNYAFDFGTGVLTIDPKLITGTVLADDKTYDGDTGATGAIVLTGVVTGDDLSASATYSFGDKTAGVGKTVTATGATLGGADAGNYILDPLATAIADILRKTLTGTVTADNKTYDGTVGATGSVSLNGVVAGDTIDAVAGVYAFADKNAGVGKTVTATGVGLTGADAANYDLGPLATGVADILRKAITGALTADDKTYDGGLGATGSISLTGVIAGDTVDASGAYAFGDKTAGGGKTVTASGVTLSGADADNYDLTAVSTAIADILRKAITGAIVADDKTYDGSNAAGGSISLDGVVAGDTVQADGTLTFADKNAGLDKLVTASGLSLSGADAANYDLGPIAAAVADILRKHLTGALTADSKTYDGTTAATGAITLAGVIAGDTVGATGTFAFADKNAGAGKAVTATTAALTGADAGNYVLDPVAAAVADILRKAITASLVIDDKTYDGATTATGSVTLTGVIAGDAVEAAGSYSFADANAGADKTVTVSGMALNGADAGNYSLTGVPGSSIADILRRQVTVTADDKFKLFGQTDPALTYTVTSGSVVVGDSFTGFIARVAGESHGTYAIGQGDLALSQNYVLTFVPGAFEIRVVPSGGQDGGSALKYLRKPASWTLNWDPSETLTSEDGPICIDPVCPGDVVETDAGDAADKGLVQTASLAGWRRFLPGAKLGAKVSVE